MAARRKTTRSERTAARARRQLLDAARAVAAEHGSQTLLQADFLKGQCVLRYQPTERVWLRAAHGNWLAEDLDALAETEMVTLGERASAGQTFCVTERALTGEIA